MREIEIAKLIEVMNFMDFVPMIQCSKISGEQQDHVWMKSQFAIEQSWEQERTSTLISIVNFKKQINYMTK